MAKYTFEFKKKIVQEYLEGQGGTDYLARKYGFSSNTPIRKWINVYKEFGDKGLMRSKKINLILLNISFIW